MPVETHVTHDHWKRSTRRLLLNGPGLSGKSQSTYTLPPVRHVVVSPGEQGFSTYFPNTDTKLYFWQVNPDEPVSRWTEILREWDATVMAILEGKHGVCTTLVLDNLRALYYLIQRSKGYTADTDAREFGRYHEEFTNRLSRILASPIPYVAAIVHDGPEPQEVGSKVIQIFPDLPGAMAKSILKMFPLVIHTVRTPMPGQPYDKFEWELRPQGRMQAAGLHVPVHLLSKFPDRIPVVYDPKTQQMTGGWHEVERIITEATDGDREGAGEALRPPP